MKRVIICLSTILVVAAIAGTSYMIYTYHNSRQVIEKEKRNHNLEEKIKELESNSLKIEEELKQIQEQNQEKVRVLEVWKKELEKVKDY